MQILTVVKEGHRESSAVVRVRFEPHFEGDPKRLRAGCARPALTPNRRVTG
jgi:hypothetical protein